MKKILKSTLLMVLVTVMCSQSVLASITTKHEVYISYNDGYPSIAWNKHEITSSMPQYFSIHANYKVCEAGYTYKTQKREWPTTTRVTRHAMNQAHRGASNYMGPKAMRFIAGYSETFIGDGNGTWLPLSNTTRTFNY